MWVGERQLSQISKLLPRKISRTRKPSFATIKWEFLCIVFHRTLKPDLFFEKCKNLNQRNGDICDGGDGDGGANSDDGEDGGGGPDGDGGCGGSGGGGGGVVVLHANNG